MMEKKRSTSFGEYLKTVRLEKGIRLSDISGQTRISKDTLEALEDDDHERLPAEVFVKGFIRAYARVVGADGDVAVQRYIENRPLVDESIRFKPDETEDRSPTGTRRLIFLGIFIVIAAAAVFVLRNTEPVKTVDQAVPPRPPETAVVKKTPPVVKDIPPPLPSEVQPEPPVAVVPDKAPAPAENTIAGPQVQTEAVPSEAVASQARQHLHVRVVEETWLKVISDSLDTNEYSLSPGDTLELKADKGFNLLIGNATGIQLTFNDNPVRIPGKSGQVVTIQLP